jgi:hypothetical protein
MYIAVLLLYWFIVPMLGSGPIFFQYNHSQLKDCYKYWWAHLLFINNIVPSDRTEYCMGWSWYLPNDMQFFFLAPPLAWLYYHKRIVCYITILVIQGACYIAEMYILMSFGFKASYKESTDDYFIYYYQRPYCRIAPFFVGLIAAFSFYSYKFEEGTFWNKASNRLHTRGVLR